MVHSQTRDSCRRARGPCPRGAPRSSGPPGGVRTPRPVAWEATYSIWDRVAGRTAASLGAVRGSTWNALLDDLELLHANPLEPRRVAAPTVWEGRMHLVESTQARAKWTQGELTAFRRILGSRQPLRNPAFVHGDAFARNVLVDEQGEYAALIDWGCAGWSSLETECARLEPDALELALRRWRGRLDMPLLLRIRLDFFLEVAALSRISFDEVRNVLEECMT